MCIRISELEWVIICTFAEREENVRRGADVFHGGSSRSDLAPQHVVEDLGRVLLALEVDAVEVAEQHEQHARVVHLLNNHQEFTARAHYV